MAISFALMGIAYTGTGLFDLYRHRLEVFGTFQLVLGPVAFIVAAVAWKRSFTYGKTKYDALY